MAQYIPSLNHRKKLFNTKELGFTSKGGFIPKKIAFLPDRY